MGFNEVMNALGPAGQLLVASILAVTLLIIVLWILIPLSIIGLRGRMREIRDDQRRVLASLKEQQRVLNEILGNLVTEQQVTNDILSRLTGTDEGTQGPRHASAPPEDRVPLEEGAAAPERRPPRPLVAHR